MNNEYEAPEVIEIGNASDLILGSDKLLQVFPDSIGQPRRATMAPDDEQEFDD